MPEFELGDDGEFAEAVDTRFGVYSAQRKPARRFPFFLALSAFFACALVFVVVYLSGA